MGSEPAWLQITRGAAPLLLSIPHAGVDLPVQIQPGLVSAWLAQRDADWWVDRLYDFAAPDLGATVVRTRLSRTAIDVNRDPGGVSLYPGRETTELCPTRTFDGEPLYHPGAAPGGAAIAARRAAWFAPYHAALEAEIARLLQVHPAIVLYDCHSIRSRIPRLFDGELPVFNIGTHGGVSCGEALTAAVEAVCDSTEFPRVTNGRFTGGYITRHYGAPERGVHALQMELACRGYLREGTGAPAPDSWPPAYDERYALPMRGALRQILAACMAFAAAAARR